MEQTIITVNLVDGIDIYEADNVYQYDRGDVLKLTGLTLPTGCQVHFGFSANGKSKPVLLSNGEAVIPQEFTNIGAPIYAWVYVSGEDYGATKKTIKIPVAHRGEITDEQPTPAQESTIDQYIALLQETTAEVEENYTELSGEVGDLKSAVNEMPTMAETDAESNLDIADPQGYVIVRFEDGHIKTKNFDSSVKEPTGAVEWKISGSDLLISYGYNATVDAVVVMNEGRANDLFDFAKFCTKPKGTPLSGLETADLTVVWTSGTDMHSPFQFLAVNDPDGYYASATDPSYTGGNHKQTINGVSVKTASPKYLCYFADGVPVASGCGKCTHFEIRWANNIQAYNCVKADGTGRTSMIEYHDMIFDGVRFEEDVTLVPLENIKMKYWEAFAFISWGTTYDHVRFIDATNRGVFVPTDSNIKSGNAKTSGIVAWGNDHMIEMNVDTNIDLGKREYYTYGQDAGAYASTGNTKGYFRIIYELSPYLEMDANDGYRIHGSFRFCPVVED